MGSHNTIVSYNKIVPTVPGIILGMRPANERQCYIVTSALIGWVQTHFGYAPSQWETTLHWNAGSHWLGAYTKWSLLYSNCNGKRWVQGLYSLSGQMSYRKISWSLDVTRFGFKHFSSLWNLTGTSAVALSNFIAMQSFQHPILQLGDFTRFGGKTSTHLVSRGQGSGFQLTAHTISHLDEPRERKRERD